MRSRVGIQLLVCVLFLYLPTALLATNIPFYQVKDYGAVANGRNKDTDAIKKAIEAASQAGGGTIYFPAGTYLTGPIHLKSNITLHLDAGATLKFSTDFNDYLPLVKSRWEGVECMNFSPQIYAYQAENIAITGHGTIDGQGRAWWNVYRRQSDKSREKARLKRLRPWIDRFVAHNQKTPGLDYFKHAGFFLRPPMIQPVDCKRVRITGVKLQNPPFWTCTPVYCDDVTITGLTIHNPADSPNTDGIDPDSCSNVHISNCHISVGDDCIAIKSGRDEDGRRVGRSCENITITNCTMLDGHGGVVIGSEMSGGVRKVAISNCIFDGTDKGIRIKTTRGRGGVVEDVRVSNIVMSRIPKGPLYLTMYYSRSSEEPVSDRTPALRNIHFSDIIAKDCPVAGSILGLSERHVQDVTFNNIQIQAKTGFVCKEADGIEFHHVRIDTEHGPALQCENVSDLEIDSFRTNTPHEKTAVITLNNVQDATLQACRAMPGTDLFLRLDGANSKDIVMQDNVLEHARQKVSLSDACRSALQEKP